MKISKHCSLLIKHFFMIDLSYVLKEGDKVTAEVTEFTGGKGNLKMIFFTPTHIYCNNLKYVISNIFIIIYIERKRIYCRVKAVLDKLGAYGLPNHYAQLVYVGSRPKPQNCCPNPPL